MFVPKLARPAASIAPGATGRAALPRPLAAMEPLSRPETETAREQASASSGDFSRIPVFSPSGSRQRVEDRLAGDAATAQAPGSPAPTDASLTPAPATPGLSVSFGKVDSLTTPSGMPARIPPRVDQAVAVTLAGPDSVDISLGGSPDNGIATLDGGETVSLASSATITLRGTAQTPPGAGAVQLLAKAGATIVGLGNPFRICAIPTTVTIDKPEPIRSRRDRGLKVWTHNDSDSHVLDDLDQVKMEEQVEWVNQQGCFEGVTSGDVSGPLDANVEPHGPDSHGYPVYLINGTGSIDTLQHFVFHDLRSGVGHTLVANSGFKIHREVTAVEQADERVLWIETTKTGIAIPGAQAAPGIGSGTSGPQIV